MLLQCKDPDIDSGDNLEETDKEYVQVRISLKSKYVHLRNTFI